MIAEVISIGDELTSGERLDTNSQWISQQLGALGVQVLYHTTVADDLAANQRVFREAIARVDLVVATGGLGPTADDLTREALAGVTGVELVLHEPSLAHIRGIFARYQREMPERNVLQAMFPRGSRPIFNPGGTAPGIELDAPRPQGGNCRVFALPGVPAEMHEMFRQSVAPAIERLMPERRVICHRRLKCFGAGESHIEAMLPDLIRRGRTPSVGITVHEATITLRITATGSTAEACAAAMEPTAHEIRQCLGDLVFGEEDDELQHVVIRLLAERGQTLATTEIGTGGILHRWLREAAPGGQGYAGAAAADTLLEPTAIGAEMSSGSQAEHLATGVRARFKSDFGLAIGAFPQGDDRAAEAPAYFYAQASENRVIVKSSTLASHSAIQNPRAAKLALNLLRLVLLEREVE